MAVTRRRFVAGAAGLAAAHALLPAVARAGAAFGKTPAHPGTAQRNRLVVIHLNGGNDGLNTVIPTAGRGYDVYRKVRPALHHAPHQTLPLDLPRDRAHHLGLNAHLKTLHRLYRDGRVAIVQGVDYANHNYSHFTSGDIWHSGEPGRAADSGWLGRHLDRVGAGDGELRGVAVGYQLPLMLKGHTRSGIGIRSIAATRFPDGTGAVADARHDALALFDHHARSEPLRRAAGIGARQAVDLVDVLRTVPAAKTTGTWIGDQLLTARTLLGLDLGVECVYLTVGGYDTHTDQKAAHETLLTQLDQALEAFFLGSAGGHRLGIGPLPAALASRTLVMVVSEFGRRIGENGTGSGAGTDHGAAAPVLLVGPKGRVGAGLHGEHPALGTTGLPADNLAMTTDLRRLYETVLRGWLHDPDPLYSRLTPLPGLLR
ncbi:MAG TPA: DUF1501 domain-containing protein [Mycobacteriales bacterium]|jgi:uncharacterized protein (DUF1501 family)|nr:DUF1501 domain-containing protein [Mycobacteriales bacterium]